MKTNLKLLLPAALVFATTFVASGKPLPLLTEAQAAISGLAAAIEPERAAPARAIRSVHPGAIGPL